MARNENKKCEVCGFEQCECPGEFDNCGEEHLIKCPYCDYEYQACQFFTDADMIGNNEVIIPCYVCNKEFAVYEDVAIIYSAFPIVKDGVLH